MKVTDDVVRENLDLKSMESWSIRFWSENDVYRKIVEKSRRSGRKLYFLDGPPYASAPSIHLGTAWNKVLKDALLRYYRMRGFDVWDKPGYDTHGLPIEVMVEKLLGIKNKKEIEDSVGIERFVGKCLEIVQNNIKSMSESFKQLGVFMDWDNPYLTYTDDYIESGWFLIKKAYERGLLYKSGKVLHWCPRCETTLADYEVSEYADVEDPSIYVKFKVKGAENLSLLIWTTTPWTLPANAFVMAHPDLEYAEVDVAGERLILLASRVDEVMREAGVRSYRVTRKIRGKELEGLEYVHPLEDLVPAQKELSRYHRVVMAPEAVNPNEGTGLVHAAPGHGDIDFEIGTRLGVPPVSLVDARGYMAEGAGKYKGLYFRTEANEEIIKDLRERGALLHQSKIVHRYPICWRCKTPLVLRLTEQWFIAVSRLKKELVEEASKVEWVPSWAKTRMLNLLENVQDWVISRQRYWGIPLPIWICTRCGHVEVVGSVDELVRLGGQRPPNLHRPWIDQVTLRCPVCGGEMRRVPDVADVWFDSGIAFYASLGYPRNKDLYERLMPADLILEGHDQIRGWFFSLLRSGVIAFGSSPYKKVLVHGFVLDEQGREMHKSLGNYVAPEDLLAKYPRDVVRTYLLKNTTWEDLRFSWRNLELTARDFTIIKNVFTFASLYMSLDSFDPELVNLDDVKGHLTPEDRWLLSRLNRLIRDYIRHFEALEVHEAVRELRDFIVEDVSRWYLRLIRRRVWIEEDSPSKRAAYYTLYTALKNWVLLAAPVMPHLAEYYYQKLVRPAEPDLPESVHMADLPNPDEGLIDDALERKMAIVRAISEEALSARMRAGIKLRRPLRRLLVMPKSPDVSSAVSELSDILAVSVNVKSVELVSADLLESLRSYEVEPDMGEIGRDFKKLTPKIVEYIRARGSEIAKELLNKGFAELDVDGTKVRLEARHVKVRAVYPDWLVASESDLGIIGLDKRVSEEEELEGIAREIVRRVQYMRKRMNLRVDAYIDLWLAGDEELLGAASAKLEYIKGETRSVNVTLGEPPKDAYTAEWEVDERRLVIGIRERKVAS